MYCVTYVNESAAVFSERVHCRLDIQWAQLSIAHFPHVTLECIRFQPSQHHRRDAAPVSLNKGFNALSGIRVRERWVFRQTSKSHSRPNIDPVPSAQETISADSFGRCRSLLEYTVSATFAILVEMCERMLVSGVD